MSHDDGEKELKDLTENDKEKFFNDLTNDEKEKDIKNLTKDGKEKLSKILNDNDKETDTTNDDGEYSGKRSIWRIFRKKVEKNNDSKNDSKAKTDTDKEKGQNSKSDEERERDLMILFDLSCEVSTGKGGAVPLDGVQSWFRHAGISNAYNIRDSDIGSAYRKSVEDETGITFKEFKEMIAKLAREKQLDPIEILDKLSSAGTPQPEEVIDYERKIGRD